MSKDENLKFVDMANPHAWLLTADNLHEQALFLRKSEGRSLLSYRGRDGGSVTWDGGNRAMFLLGGFALENALKAFLVYENPIWISNGTLGKPLRSHSLTKLQGMATTVPYKNRMLWVLKGFEDGIESWSRYPCALTAKDSRMEARMTETLWDGYMRLMDAYGNRLRKLITAKVWYGPHGFEGRWQFYGKPVAPGEGMGRQGFKALSASPYVKMQRLAARYR